MSHDVPLQPDDYVVKADPPRPPGPRWLVTGTGDNRHTIRQAISQLPRAVRLPKAQQMQHRRDIAELRQHPLAGGNAETTLRNALRRRRQGRVRPPAPHVPALPGEFWP